MSEQKMEQVHKVTLSTSKEVLIRDMKIQYQELAMKAVGDKAGDNRLLAAQLMQKELVKILIYKVGNKVVSGPDLEKLDDLFSFQEYGQLTQAIDKILGGSDMGNFQTEIVTIGSR